MVIFAEQGEVVQISRSAVDPVQDVVPVAVVGGMGAAGNEQPPSRMCRAMVWPWVASRLVLPRARGTLLWLMMVARCQPLQQS